MEFLIVLAVLAVVVFVLTGPLRASRERDAPSPEDIARAEQTDELAELEAERDAKYREIRDAELDYQTGKLSASDFAAIDSTLRAEAIEILHAIDRAGGGQGAPAAGGASSGDGAADGN
jgi:hypothetical protein